MPGSVGEMVPGQAQSTLHVPLLLQLAFVSPNTPTHLCAVLHSIGMDGLHHTPKKFWIIQAGKHTKYINYVLRHKNQCMKPGGGASHFHLHCDSTCYFFHGFLQSKHPLR